MYIMELQNWIGNNIQDWAFFQLIQIGRIFIKEKFLLHNLIEDCTYLVQPWIYSPFKGCAEV